MGEEWKNTHPLRLAKGIGSSDVDRDHQSALLASRKSGKSGKGEGGKGAEQAVLTHRDKVPLWSGSGSLKRST